MVELMVEMRGTYRDRMVNDEDPVGFRYRAIAIDLDGTIIGKNQRISYAVAEAIMEAANRVPVSIVTGRESRDLMHYARELGLTQPQVCDNGALVLDPISGQEIWSSPLGSQNSKKILMKLKNLGVTFIATRPQQTVSRYEDIDNWNFIRISALNLDSAVASALSMEYDDVIEIDAVTAYLPYNGLWAVDFTRGGINKAAGVTHLARLLSLCPEQIVAVGDSYNDLPMLECCGLAVAMGDGPEEIRNAANFVAPSVDEDGLAVAIQEFILPRLWNPNT